MPFAAERLRISNRANGFLSAWGLMATTEHEVPEAPTLMRPLPNAERKGSSEGRIVPEDGEGDGGDPSFFF